MLSSFQFFPKIIPYRKDNLWGFTDNKKNWHIEPKYTRAYPFVGSLALVAIDEKLGFIDKQGKEVIPIELDEVGDLEGNLFSEDGSVLIRKKDKWGLLSHTGEILADISFDSAEAVQEDAVKNGWLGHLPGEWLSPELALQFSRDNFWISELGNFSSEGEASFRRGLDWGILNVEGKILLPAQYEFISSKEGNYWPFMIGGKWGLLESSGKIALKAEFDEVRGFSEGNFACCRKGEFWGAFDVEDKRWVLPAEYQELGEFKEGLFSACKNDLYGFINESGQEKIPFKFQYTLNFYEGKCGVFENEATFYFINKKGERVSEVYTPYAGPHSDNSMHVVIDDKWGLVKSNGELSISIENDLVRAFGQVVTPFVNGFSSLKKGPYMGVIDEKGQRVVEPKYITWDPYCEKRALVSVINPKLAQYTNTPEQMEAEGSISGNFLFGFIDENGKEVVPPKYSYAKRFSSGLAYVEGEFKQGGYVNYDGEEFFE